MRFVPHKGTVAQRAMPPPRNPLAFQELRRILGRCMEELVLALPSRDFIALRGYAQRLDLPVLEALQQETWLAVPAAIREDPLAVGIEIGLLLERGGEVLLGPDGRLLERAPVVPDEIQPGAMLVALRKAAESRAGRRVGQPTRAELSGWFHDPTLAPRTLLLVYRARLPEAIQVAAGSWISRGGSAALVQDRLEQLVLAGLPPIRPP
jgi:hypothetical protein